MTTRDIQFILEMRFFSQTISYTFFSPFSSHNTIIRAELLLASSQAHITLSSLHAAFIHT